MRWLCQEKQFSFKPDDQSSIPETQKMEGEKQPHGVSSDLHLHVMPCSHLHMCLCVCMHVYTHRDVKLFLNASTRGGVSLSGYQNRVVNGGIYYNMIWGPGRQMDKLE